MPPLVTSASLPVECLHVEQVQWNDWSKCPCHFPGVKRQAPIQFSRLTNMEKAPCRTGLAGAWAHLLLPLQLKSSTYLGGAHVCGQCWDTNRQIWSEEMATPLYRESSTTLPISERSYLLLGVCKFRKALLKLNLGLSWPQNYKYQIECRIIVFFSWSLCKWRLTFLKMARNLHASDSCSYKRELARTVWMR